MLRKSELYNKITEVIERLNSAFHTLSSYADILLLDVVIFCVTFVF